MAQTVKHLPAVRETWVQSLGWEDPLQKEMAPHSSTLAWKIPGTEEPGRLQSMGSQRVGHDWATSLLSLLLRKASRRCVESHQQNSSRNISTPLVWFCLCLLQTYCGAEGLEIKAGMTERKQREWNGPARLWRIVRWGAKSHLISLEVFNRKKKKSKETKPVWFKGTAKWFFFKLKSLHQIRAFFT